MPTTYGQIPDGLIIPQPDFSPRQNEEGGWIADRSYAMSKATWETASLSTFSRGNYIGSFDANAPTIYNFLRINSKQIVFQEGDIVVVAVSFAGSATNQYEDDGLGADALPTYRLSGSLAEKSLSYHPKFQALVQAEQNTLSLLLDGKAEYLYSEFDVDYKVFYARDSEIQVQLPEAEQLTSDDAKSFATSIASGRKTYNVPEITWTETTQGNQPLTSAQINKLGYIASTRGNPPEPSGGRNWMLTNIEQESAANVNLYRTMIQWTLSERGGHDSFIYDDTP